MARTDCMQALPILQPGDTVEIIAPASRCENQILSALATLLTSWQLNCIVEENIFGNDILCANTDEIRFQLLKKALQRPETKAVICVRGGYGSMRLIPELSTIKPPAATKIFLGMSDITALHLFLQQNWHWPTLHGSLSQDKFSPESIAFTKSILFGETRQVTFSGKALNTLAEKSSGIDATITGGNLCLVQTSIGTLWQMDGRDKIIFLEEVGERGYRVDRMLEQLQQANLFKNAAAIVFGDFTEGDEKDGSSLIQPVLERFAQQCKFPVVKISGIGHGKTNFPLPMGTKANLRLGKNIQLTGDCRQ